MLDPIQIMGSDVGIVISEGHVKAHELVDFIVLDDEIAVLLILPDHA